MARIVYPFKYYAEYTDGTARYFYGTSEDNCIGQIADSQAKHGRCVYYTGVNDEDYVDGEYVGAENFIYE